MLVLHQHMNEPVPDLRGLRPETPPALAEAITRALAKDQDDRWPSAAEMLAALGAPVAAG